MNFFYFFYKAVGAFSAPPGIVIALCLAAGIFFFRRKSDRSGKFLSPARFAFFIAVLLYVLSVPFSAKAFLNILEGQFSTACPKTGEKPVVLVLAGGIWSMETEDRMFAMSAETLQRFAAGAEIAEKLDAPLLYSGGYPEKASEKQIAEMAVRTARSIRYDGSLIVEGRSRTTWENLLFSSEIISGEAFSDVVLVTSAFHLKRSMRAAKRFLGNIQVHPAASGRLEGAGAVTAMDFLPSPSGLRNTSLALRELIGLAAYDLFASLN
ncbi:MAG: YdcF family protein [Synergistaceae bacterium]|jgi:uncharacterized SAM-binding protein YcdF (DUF218 family)|uniref:YdcF family protein n=1 Tax=Aminivibrio sp. TaxID=1872489 RepID=UPI0016AB55E1|nr:YdcF family protein [Synergistaceae bacterium]NCC57348.1 YdcF family protein [Synergistales bacterium]MDD3389986.1 YdcF family protein [Synergistaceae bacterium]MDD3688622.1 YdcF family protein [Synergistaceae bacterium]MDD4021914.1 YdcF family protein [Synergistaceae bacterium]